MPAVYESPVAAAQLNGVRGPNRRAYDDFVLDLRRRGCEAMGYRVTGDTLDHLCVRHLRGTWRVVVAFTKNDEAWVVLVGQHTDDTHNIYDLLYRVVGVEPEPHEKRRKPPCCGEDNAPPVAGEDLIGALTRRTRDAFPRR